MCIKLLFITFDEITPIYSQLHFLVFLQGMCCYLYDWRGKLQGFLPFLSIRVLKSLKHKPRSQSTSTPRPAEDKNEPCAQWSLPHSHQVYCLFLRVRVPVDPF